MSPLAFGCSSYTQYLVTINDSKRIDPKSNLVKRRLGGKIGYKIHKRRKDKGRIVLVTLITIQNIKMQRKESESKTDCNI